MITKRRRKQLKRRRQKICWCCRQGEPVEWFLDPVVAESRVFCEDHQIELAAAMLKLNGCARACENCGQGLAQETISVMLGVCSPDCRNELINRERLSRGKCS